MSNVPNLDSLDAKELWDFWRKYNRCGYKKARELFPDRPHRYITVARDLSHYACNKAVVIDRRLKGEIRSAEVYENICDRIYRRLPTYAIW